MKTVRSYLFRQRTITIRYPRVTFEPNGYDRWNMWHLLGWLFSAAMLVAFATLIGMSVLYAGNRLHMKAVDRTPPQPLDAKKEFAKRCDYEGGVTNVGPENPKEWECKKL